MAGPRSNEESAKPALSQAASIRQKRREESRKRQLELITMRRELEAQRAVLTQPANAPMLRQKVKALNELHKKIELNSTRELGLDVDALVTLAEFGQQMGMAMGTATTQSFLEHLVGYVGNNFESQGAILPDQEEPQHLSAEDWAGLGHHVMPMFRGATPRSIDWMRGPLQREHVVRQRNTTTRVRLTARQVRPREMAKDDVAPQDQHGSQQRLTFMREQLAKVCQNGKSIPYWNFLLNPHCFGQSVENMFDFAFLVRDSLASVELNSIGLPMIRTVSQDERQADVNAARHACVMHLDTDSWRELIDAFQITEPMIPHREYDENHRVTNLPTLP